MQSVGFLFAFGFEVPSAIHFLKDTLGDPELSVDGLDVLRRLSVYVL